MFFSIQGTNCFLFFLLFSSSSCSAPTIIQQRPTSTTTLKAELTSTQKEIERIREKWNDIRLLPREEAASSLEGEWKEAYDRFYARYDKDMERMLEITGKLKDMIEPPRIQKKTEGQRKRDKWAKIQAREAARAAKMK
jgi:hypothetical protein